MYNLSFAPSAWEEYTSWGETDKKTFRRINALIKDIQRNGFLTGIGHPEKLKYSTEYSRHINDFDRLIYEGEENVNLLIVSCKGHYGD
ncbi:txe/YoeB family addiction module toxin [Synergistales bacterium]|nr:txe/YoeB family addiction module toxin [Synergistales bacterium]